MRPSSSEKETKATSFYFVFFIFFVSAKTEHQMRPQIHALVVFSLLIFSLFTVSLYARPFVLFLSQEDLKDTANSPDDSSSSDPSHHDSAEWDEFGDSDAHKSDEELDPGSWRPIFEPDSSSGADPGSVADAQYYSGVSKMVRAVSSGEVNLMDEAAKEIEAAVAVGHPHARSVLGFLNGAGQMRERNKAKAFMYHYFAADGGNMQSKMALAYTYFKQEVRKP